MGYPTWYTSSACRMNGAKLGKVADYNGDGKMDISCYVPGGDPSLGDVQFVGVSTGTAFAPAAFSNMSCPQPYGNLAAQGQADFNGDGRDDWFCTASNTGDTMVFFSAGNQFWYNNRTLTNFCSATEYSFGDWNGDGATDAACANNLRAGLHTGDRFSVLDAPAPAAYCVTGQRVAADLDGDGAAEWICNNPGTPANDIQVRRWAGLAFGAAQTWRGSFCAGNLTVADYNGDGKKDLICESSGAVIYAGTKNLKADLLLTSSNGIGGSSTLAYTTTTQHLTASSAGLPPKYIITSTTASDGRNPTPATTTFQYFTGAQDDKERKFYGFQTVYEYPPALSNESASPIIARRFRIDAAAAGRPEVVNTYNSLSKILTKTVYSYATDDVTGAGARRQVFLSAVENFRFSGTTPDCWTVNCEARSSKVEYTYDNYGNVLQVTNHGDVVTSGDETTTLTDYVYNPAAYIVGTAGQTQTYAGVGTSGKLLGHTYVMYDQNGSWSAMPTKGDVTRTEAWLDPSNTFVASTATYDSRGNVATSTDPTGSVSTITYDAMGLFPVTAMNAAGESTTTAWDAICGVPSSTTDANGVVTLFATDNFCRPTTTTLPGPLVASSTTYLNLGTASTQRVRVETPGGGSDGTVHWSESYFDGFGRTYKTVSRGAVTGQPIIAESTFDQRGNVASQKAPYYSGVTTSPVTTFEYDALNRLIKTNLPGGGSRTTNYTGLSQDWSLFKTESVNELGQTTRTFSDVLGRVRTTTQVSATLGDPTTTREYDRLGRMTKLIDDDGNEWRYAFDTLGRTTSKHDPDAGNATFTYDTTGRLLTQVDAKSQATILEYDIAGRLKKKTTREGGLIGTVKDVVETTYGTNPGLHNVGRVTQMVTKDGGGLEKTGKLAFEYDDLGRVVKQTRTIDGHDYVVEKAFDAAGYLRGIKYPDGDIVGGFGGYGSNLTYDQAGRLSSIPGILTSVTYNALGAPLVQSNANLTTTTKGYDANRLWLTDIDTTGPNPTILQDLHYTMNAAGMAMGVDSNIPGEDWAYKYHDDLNFLMSSKNQPPPWTPGGSNAEDQAWTYDGLGRFTSNSRVGTTYTYPSSGPNSVRPHAPTSITGGLMGAISFDYDPNGNLESDGNRTMTWDVDNRITKVVKGGTTTDFTYGPDGTRIKKVSGGQVVLYPFGDDYEINGATVTKYINAGFGTIAKRVGTMATGFVTSWLHADRLGSINAVTDSTGAQVLRQSFRSYGDLIGQPPTPAESLGYIGQRTDTETGLTYLHARYYDPILGAFLSPDPANADIHSYRYAGGDPVNYLDLLGLARSKADEQEMRDACATLADPDAQKQCNSAIDRALSEDVVVTADVDDAAGPLPGIARRIERQIERQRQREREERVKQRRELVGCFVEGAVDGAVGAIVVGALAVGAVTLGAPVAVVTGALFFLGGYGGAVLGANVYADVNAGNWNAVAYEAGTVAGGAAAGGAGGGRATAEGITGVPSPRWSPRSDVAQMWNPSGQLGALAIHETGPSPGSAGGANTLIAGGAGAGGCR